MKNPYAVVLNRILNKIEKTNLHDYEYNLILTYIAELELLGIIDSETTDNILNGLKIRYNK